MAYITLQGINKIYPNGFVSVKDFSLHIEDKELVAFHGPHGCGKSTISKLISGLYQPWSGEILFDGKPIDSIDRDVFTGSLAVVDQDIIPMIRKLTVEAADNHICRIGALICCQNPALNPAQLPAAISRYLPELTPDFVHICRREIYDSNKEIFR